MNNFPPSPSPLRLLGLVDWHWFLPIHLHADPGAKRFNLLRNLDGQLSGGWKDERKMRLWFLQQFLKDREGELQPAVEAI